VNGVPTGDNTEAFYLYDSITGDPDLTSIPNFTIDGTLTKGRLVAVSDRGAKTVTRYDGRGRVTGTARRLAKPGIPADVLANRYTAGSSAPFGWFTQTVQFDGADRLVSASTGADVPELAPTGASNVITNYTRRGTVGSVTSSYGDLVTNITRDADGLITQTVYGDTAKTASAFSYDDRRRLWSVQTYRGAPAIWSQSPPPICPSPDPDPNDATRQLLLEDVDYHYDQVDNPIEIDDFRNPAEWPSGAKPVTRKIQYDDLYRVTRVDYAYPAGNDGWISPFKDEDSGTPSDPRRAVPSPHVSFPNRVLWQSFQYDWLGNTKNTDDDAHGFYDRSLGTITNGTPTAGPYQLQAATSADPTNGGSFSAVGYDAAGNLTRLTLARNGPCLGASCSQRFVYAWDEVGRLVDAQRFDGGAATASVELTYAYDASDERTLKTAIDPSGGGTVYDAYVFGSLELRRTTFDSTANDYVRNNSTEVPYLLAHGVRLARLHYALASEPTLSSGQLHVLFELPDHLESTSIVVDKDTSELVERGTYMAYAQADSDYRPVRWNAFREDYRFTGKEEDVEVGLQYFGKRYFAPGLGRWTSADPLAVHGLGADFNVYAYVHGSLLRVIDPTGLADTGVSSTCGTSTCTGPGEEQSTTVSRAVPTIAPSAASTGDKDDEAPPDCIGCSHGGAIVAAVAGGGFGGFLDFEYAEAHTRPDAGVEEKESPPGGLKGTPGTDYEDGLLAAPIMRQLTGIAVDLAVAEGVGRVLGGSKTRISSGSKGGAPPSEGAAISGAGTSTGQAPPLAVASALMPPPALPRPGTVRMYRGTSHPNLPQVSLSMRGVPAADVPSGAEHFLHPMDADLHARSIGHADAVSATTSPGSAKLYGTHTVVYDVPEAVVERLPPGDKSLRERVFMYSIPEEYRVGVTPNR
jgi:RHS repeat-associated protein